MIRIPSWLVFSFVIALLLAGDVWAEEPGKPDEQGAAPDLVVKVYRVLGFDDGKYSGYRLVRAGGRLDSDMFPESIARRSFKDVDHYARFLARRHVDYIWVLDSYDRRYRTNEHALLARWAAEQTCASASIRVTVQLHTAAQDVYAIEHCSPI